MGVEFMKNITTTGVCPTSHMEATLKISTTQKITEIKDCSMERHFGAYNDACVDNCPVVREALAKHQH